MLIATINIPLSNKVVIVVHGAPLTNTREHVAADCRVMGVADNSASKQPGKGIRKGVATGVDIVSRSELGQGLPCEVDRAKALPNHGQAWVRGFLDPLPLVQMHHLQIPTKIQVLKKKNKLNLDRRRK